jgi:hypothetical protein
MRVGKPSTSGNINQCRALLISDGGNIRLFARVRVEVVREVLSAGDAVSRDPDVVDAMDCLAMVSYIEGP